MKDSIINKFKKDLENKKIAIWGLGKEGISTLQFIKNNNINCKEIAVLERKDTKIEGVKKLNNQKELNGYDLIFKSPGIVIDKNIVDTNRITSQTEEFIKILSSQIIGITGTKGKSTTSSLTYTILKQFYPNTILVGNIGIPCFNAINEIDENTNIIFELSCHQLEFINYSPHIAVILNLFPEHLDHYKSLENYISAKLNINKFQKDNDSLIYGENCKPYINSKITNNICISDYINKRSIKTLNNKIEILEGETNLIGEHNLFNIAVAYYICSEIYKISNENFKEVLKKFTGLEHRLEFVAKKDDVLYYDDSISTIGETTIEGIKALKNVNTLILGGMDRHIDYSNLEKFIVFQKNLENIILMPDTGKRIYKELQVMGNNKKCYLVENLKEAVNKAREVTKKNTICLLSPAAASYGFFKNFEERGNKFKEYIK